MDATNFNDDKPSRADYFRRDPYEANNTDDVIDRGIKAAQEGVASVSEPAGEALDRGNEVVSSRVGAIPVLALGVTVGLAVGYLLGIRARA